MEFHCCPILRQLCSRLLCPYLVNILMKHSFLYHIIILLSLFQGYTGFAQAPSDYQHYHQQVIAAETLITQEEYQQALDIYDQLIESYDFIFLKDYQVATQLAAYLGDDQKTADYLQQAIHGGWKKKSIKKNEVLADFRKSDDWKAIRKAYPELRSEYEASLNQPVRKQVNKMIVKDQKKALLALFAFSPEAQDRYAENKFAPHSERQLAEFIEILGKYGYPGEQLIGNDVWMSTILSHHNSISQSYAEKDTIYNWLKPKLIEAVKDGHLSPYHYALIDEWNLVVMDDTGQAFYGFLDAPSQSRLEFTNELRQKAMIRPIEVRNGLVDIQEKTGIDFYLQGNPWDGGKIDVIKSDSTD